MAAARQLRGPFTEHPVNNLFFSALNVHALQQALRWGVFQRTGQVIGPQSEQELSVVMRSIYLQHAVHAPGDATAQVRALNARVLEYCVHAVSKEVRGYQAYARTVDASPLPMPHAVNVSIKGDRVLELTTAAPPS